jgi:hypothetical protein
LGRKVIAMAIPPATEWNGYTKTAATDPQLNTRLNPVHHDALSALAARLRLSPGALTRLIVTAVVDGSTVSEALLLRRASESVINS